MKNLKIVYLPVDSLKPYEKNARKHNERNIAAIKASITEFGMNDPIGIWGEKNIIIEGHGRVIACKELGMTEVPCIRLDYLTEEERRAYTLAHNKTAELADWDFDTLNVELEDITDIDMSLFGFSDDIEIETTRVKDIEIPQEAESVCKTGDIWQLGRHRLICGDSSDKTVIDRLLNGESADLYFVDPPYDIEDLYNVIPDRNQGKTLIVSYDHKHFIKPIITATNRGWIGQYEFIWNCVQSWYTQNRPLARHKTVAVFKDNREWNFEKAIIKDEKERSKQKGINTRGEYDYTPLDGAHYFRTVEEFSNTAQNDECGQGKPVQWIGAILAGIDKFSTVLDYFGGSGSVLCGCEQLNKICYTVEIDEHLCDLIISRWENLTGDKAVKVN